MRPLRLRIRAWSWTAACALLAAGCGSPSIPEANRALREVPLTSNADLEAHAEADAAHDQLNEWCDAAVSRRELGEELDAEDPVLAPEALELVETIRDAGERAESAELVSVLSALADAHLARLELLRRPGKHRPKRYLDAQRKVVELGFGLRRWRHQR